LIFCISQDNVVTWLRCDGKYNNKGRAAYD